MRCRRQIPFIFKDLGPYLCPQLKGFDSETCSTKRNVVSFYVRVKTILNKIHQEYSAHFDQYLCLNRERMVKKRDKMATCANESNPAEYNVITVLHYCELCFPSAWQPCTSTCEGWARDWIIWCVCLIELCHGDTLRRGAACVRWAGLRHRTRKKKKKKKQKESVWWASEMCSPSTQSNMWLTSLFLRVFCCHKESLETATKGLPNWHLTQLKGKGYLHQSRNAERKTHHRI